MISPQKDWKRLGIVCLTIMVPTALMLLVAGGILTLPRGCGSGEHVAPRPAVRDTVFIERSVHHAQAAARDSVRIVYIKSIIRQADEIKPVPYNSDSERDSLAVSYLRALAGAR